MKTINERSTKEDSIKKILARKMKWGINLLFLIFILSISTLLYSQQNNDTDHAFFLKGWNYDKKLPIKIYKNNSNEKNKFIEAIPFNNSIYLFYFQTTPCIFQNSTGKPSLHHRFLFPHLSSSTSNDRR